MTNRNTPENQPTRRTLPIAWATALAVAFTVSLAQPVHADMSHRHPYPSTSRCRGERGLPGGARRRHPELHLPALGLRLRLDTVHAGGHPVHGIRRSPPTSSAPTRMSRRQGIIRATWQHSRDTSTVWAQVFHHLSTDANFVEPDAIPWLLLQRAGVQAGPAAATR